MFTPSPTRFGRVLTAMVTPFESDGSIDLDGAQNLAKYLVANGNDGVVVAGTTGESPTLSFEEHMALVGAVREAIPDHHLIAGSGSNDTRVSVRNTERVTELGADGILSVTPYYNKPSQAGLEAHFKASAAATDLPVIIYDHPGRTGRKISEEVLLRLLDVENIVGIKDAAGDPASTAQLLARAPQDTDLYSGDDALTLPFLSVGGCGVIGVATHWAGLEVQEMIAAFFTGDAEQAIAINRRLLASWQYENTLDAPNPVPSKAMMNLLGVPVGECRLPMRPEPDGLQGLAREVLRGLDRSA